ncbi:putative ribonuclease inhibitor [Hafnia paralvei ATCC 29927]|jgi:ribonuclease inhibitor|uniref:Barstar (barnase inhibitor) domain-containing protein n=1 Tax=Hafnia paralvei TaxID=546367 RepID=A0A2A2MAC6_9GAMM|nr:barstar family protein [Hafnia paralvei]MDU1191589.1 barstar family protein [Enterobacteriaceae bacterium]KHS50443.1 hypothetical protein RN38_02610 [Hafnia paralvei]MBU2674263.1 barstar family protein [Hafnia paralvei]MBW2960095.1 barstar family protein [Hafnia paralvei]MCE9881061.1 barstar family protein [Hafnia paralvei]
MNKVKFDFNHIADLPAFYRQFSHEFSLDSEFGNNLDALWDAVTGGIKLPVEIDFVNFNGRKKRRFAALVLLFEEAEEELEGALRFNMLEKTV